MTERWTSALSHVRCSDDPGVLRTKSQDYNWFSPILKSQLDAKIADIVMFPRNEDELKDIVRHAVRDRVHLTVRGGGTGNYGQCVPLAGGCVIDMAAFDGIIEMNEHSVTAQSGIRIDRLQDRLRQDGRELRLYPSSQRMSSLGGFLGGGAGGVGSVTWGFLWDPGNVIQLRVMTIEEEPRIIRLRGEDLGVVLHAYGTTGIILDIEMPLTSCHPWVETMWAFPDLRGAVAFSQALASDEGIVKRDVATIQQGVAGAFKPLAPWYRPEDNIVLASTAAASDTALDALGARFAAEKRFRLTEADLEARKLPPNYEYGWNHATLNFLKSDRSVTYIQCAYPLGREIECTEAITAAFGDEVKVQMQWVRDGEDTVSAGLNIIRYTTPERLREIAAIHRNLGVEVNNCHSFQIETGDAPTAAHMAMAFFKQEVDPLHLLNPGKLAAANVEVKRDPDSIPEGFAL